MLTYIFKVKTAFHFRDIFFAEPHWCRGNKSEAPADGDTNLDSVVTWRWRRGVWSHGKLLKLETDKTVQVDKHKVVDGGTEKNNFHRGHHVTHQWTKGPPGNIIKTQESSPTSSSLPSFPERVDGDDDAHNHVYHSQRDDHQAESLHESENITY